jgi:hypothetical protein
MTTTIPHRAKQALQLHVDFINEEIVKQGAPADLGELFDCEDATFHKFTILQDSANQYALGFIDAMALVKGVAPESLLAKKPKPKAKPKRKKKTGERKTTGPDATVIRLHRGGKG